MYWEGDVTHHAVGERVAGLGHRQTLDHLRSHPGKRAHQRHVCRVVQEPGCPEITDLQQNYFRGGKQKVS